MTKKLIVIILSLVLVQLTVYTITHYNEDKIQESVKVFIGKYEPTKGRLNLSNRNLKTLPKAVLKYDELTSINLDLNQFEEFPYELLSMPNLERIFIRHNLLEEIDFTKVDLTKSKLRYLYLKDNRIVDIKGLEQFIQLKELDVSENYLEQFDINKIPDSMLNLDLHDNMLSSFMATENHPNRILRTLNLTDNRLDSIKIDSFGVSPFLQELELNDNDIKFLDIRHNHFIKFDIRRINNSYVHLEMPYLKDLEISVSTLKDHYQNLHLPSLKEITINTKTELSDELSPEVRTILKTHFDNISIYSRHW